MGPAMINGREHVPELLQASSLSESDLGVFEWDREHNPQLLTTSDDGKTIHWGPRKPEYSSEQYPPAWVPARTHAHLHSGGFRWDFMVDEMAEGQIGIGFMLVWDVGVDWGFFGYLGASSTAWAYDPSTGDVVCRENPIEGGLPKFRDGRTGVVSVELDLPRHAEGSARFLVESVASTPISLPRGAVLMPAACLLRESQRVTLAGFDRE